MVETKSSPLVFNDAALPTKVKFFTRYPDACLDGDAPLSCNIFYEDPQNQTLDLPNSQFEAKVKQLCGDAFNSELSLRDDKDWNKVFSIIKDKDFSFSKLGWGTAKSVFLPSGSVGIRSDLYIMAQSLERALLTKMNNGEAKKFIAKLLNNIQVLEGGDDIILKVTHESPVRHSFTNGEVQLLGPHDVDAWENDNVSRDYVRHRRLTGSSLEDSDDEPFVPSEVHPTVPDHIWYLHQYPGYFVLNVDCKPVASFNDRIHCIHEILTQMHFQNSAFGLLISQKGWHLFFINKRDDLLSIYQTSSSFINRKNSKFDVESFKLLCSWLYKILDFRHKCVAG